MLRDKAEAAARERQSKTCCSCKVSSNGKLDYVRRVPPNVRDRQLKLLTTEKPDWRDGEQLSKRD